MVQRPLNFAIIDEVDSILIDEARTPLIISGQSEGTTGMYKRADRFAKTLTKDEDYKVDLESKTVALLDEGIRKAEKYFGLENLYDTDNTALNHYLDEALRANYIMLKDKDYVISDGQALIVDSFTGRIMDGRYTKQLKLRNTLRFKKKPRRWRISRTKTYSGCTKSYLG